MNLKEGPYRLYCTIPVEYLPHITNIIPKAMRTLIHGGKIVIPEGVCFELNGYCFHIQIDEYQDKEYRVLIQDVPKEHCQQKNKLDIDPEIINEIRDYMESKYYWRDN